MVEVNTYARTQLPETNTRHMLFDCNTQIDIHINSFILSYKMHHSHASNQTK
jgi:hypothetical protein